MNAYKIKYKGGIKKVTLFRNLLAKMLYLNVTIEEVLVIYDLYELCLTESEQKVDFDRKYGAWLITCYALLNKINPQSFPYSLDAGLRAQFIEALVPLLPSKRAFLSWEGNPVNVNSFRVSVDLRLKARKPSTYRLGKGYTDKGSARNPARDGSPDWKEVARADIPQRPVQGKFDSHVILHGKVQAKSRADAILEAIRN